MGQEYYWSIIIEDSWVQAGIWTIEEKLVRVLASSAPLRWEAEEDLVEVVNTALSSAVQDFPESAEEPSKTVFGVAPSWVVDGQIGKEHLGKIRQICSKLSLSPSGFVVLPEAMAHNIRLSEKSPFSGIIVGVGRSVLDVTVFRLGNLVGTVNVGKSVSVVDDVVEGLGRFATGEHLPSRIMIYDGKDAELEDTKQALLAADWNQTSEGKIKFLHTPLVEIISVEDKLVAVSLAGASEIGEVEGAKLSGDRGGDEQEDEQEIPLAQEKQLEEVGGEVGETEEISPEDVGFVLGEDIRKISKMGGEEDVDVFGNAGTEDVDVEKIQDRKTGFLGGFSKAGQFVGGVLSRVKYAVMRRGGKVSLPTARIPRGGLGRRWPMLVGVLIVLLVAGLGGAWIYIPKAEISVYVSPRTLEERVTVTLDEEASEGSFEEMVIPAQAVEVEVSGSRTRSASGTKTVGEKAKGKVTIRNGTSSAIKVSSEMVLIGPNNLKFNIAESASVSAAVSPSSPGSLTTEAAAQDIGAEYNLAKGEVLTVGNYPKSEVDGIVEEDFGGGSSREIVAVSGDDLEKLEEELINELEEEGKEKLSSEGFRDKVFVGDAVRSEVAERKFSHQEGDEASSVGLDMKLTVRGLTVEKSVLTDFARKFLEAQTPEGYSLRDEQIDAEFVLNDEGGGLWEFEVLFKANLLPDINPEEIAKRVSGKRISQAQEALTTIPGFERAEVKVTPLPDVVKFIPRIMKHITVEIVASR